MDHPNVSQSRFFTLLLLLIYLRYEQLAECETACRNLLSRLDLLFCAEARVASPLLVGVGKACVAAQKIGKVLIDSKTMCRKKRREFERRYVLLGAISIIRVISVIGVICLLHAFLVLGGCVWCANQFLPSPESCPPAQV